MSSITLGLLVIAAVCHAAWNLLLKRVPQKHLVTWWALVIVSLLSLPLVFVARPSPWQVWPYILVSAGFEAGYYMTLASAYRDADFSLVYPLARGTAPAFLVAWSILFLHESVSAGGLAGVAVILTGLMILGSSRWFRRGRHVQPKAGSVALALMVALFISCYSAIDGAAMRHANPMGYTVAIFAVTALLLTPLMLRRHGWRTVAAAGRTHWLPAGLIGGLSLVGYTLVLMAYAHGHVSYAGAVREMSIVFGAVAGWRWLKEDFGALRTLGAAVVFSGILVIALAG